MSLCKRNLVRDDSLFTVKGSLAATGKPSRKTSRPQWAGESPQIFFFEVDLVFFEKFQIFLFKTFLPMMRLLVGNIFFHFQNLGSADRKRTISFLPLESRLTDGFVNPFRGLAFDFTEHVRKTVRRPEPDEEMHVV